MRGNAVVALLGGTVLDPALVVGAYTVSLGTLVVLIVLESALWNDAWRRKFAKPEIAALWFSAMRANCTHILNSALYSDLLANILGH